MSADQQAMEFLPAPTIRRIYHLQHELGVKAAEPSSRALLSSSFAPSSGQGTPRHAREASGASGARQTITTGNAATDLLLGVTGRNKLMAAGDKLRELIIPDALAQAVAVGVGGGGGKKTKSKKEKDRDDTRMEAARQELDGLVAGVCPLCEGSVVGLDRGFVREDEDASSWAV